MPVEAASIEEWYHNFIAKRIDHNIKYPSSLSSKPESQDEI